MGNHRFKLSDMMPNAWFYKLRDMTTTSKPKNRNPKTNSKPPPPQPASRKSYYYSTESRLTRSPSISPMNNLKSTKKQKTIYMPSPKHRSIPHSPSEESIFQEESSDTDSIFKSCKKFAEFDMVSEQDLNLPPILTRPEKKTGSARKSISRARGVKVKIRGKQGTRKTEEKQGLFCSGSLVVVKSSVDPERDFRESMMEMIAENDIRAAEDLEDLLACYLSLNSDKYHAVIIKAFERIWFNVART